MARIEKTVFISYRRKDISWALAVYQYLTAQNYDVFFDFSSIPSGDFEQIIISNIRARAHFVLILTPTALDRCSNPGDWLRREIETAMDEKRNIIPLFFNGFNFGSPAVAEKLTDKLANINRYNGLDIPSGYFMEGMKRLSDRYLNVPLDAVLHPVPTKVRKVVKEEKVAADKALKQREDVKEIIKPVDEKHKVENKDQEKKETTSIPQGNAVFEMITSWSRKISPRLYGIGAGILLVVILGILVIKFLDQNNAGKATLIPTFTPQIVTVTVPTYTMTSVKLTQPQSVPTNTATAIPPTPTPEFGIGSTMISPEDGMTLLYVPAGEFMMGNTVNDALFDNETPSHTVTLDAFWIDRTEVTNAMYTKCHQEGVCRTPIYATFFGDSSYADHPVVYVTWDYANTYCAWVDRRLPTEAEWEKTASWDYENRMKYTFPWGDFIDCSFANYWGQAGGCVGDTTKVGSYNSGKSPYGTYDMVGNVTEWVSDWYDSNYYTNSPLSNPAGPEVGQQRVLRGGGWYGWPEEYMRSTWRGSANPTDSHFTFGFRCAMDAE